MSIQIDKNGFPTVLPDKTNLGVIFSPTKTGQGNPAHDSFSGKFSFLPAGVHVLKGGDLLKSLSTSTRKIFFQRAQITRANQVSAQIVNGRLHIVLLNDGRRLDSFAVAPQGDAAQVAAQQARSDAAGAPLTGSPVIRDAIVDAARDGLEGKELQEFLQKRGIDISGGQINQILEAIDQQKKNDVVDYLNQLLRKQVHQENQIDRVRLSVGRGFLRQVFSKYSEDEIKGILDRLSARGWSQDVISSNVISKLPKRLREPIQSSFRVAKGKEEVKDIRTKEKNEGSTTQTLPSD